ncbi:MAG: creatininase family protein [Anaerolineales bacterium]|nr:creatininase family protein [Anaerolineales bacterium]
MSKSPLERTVQLERLSSPEVAQAAKDAQGIVIIPVGAVEVHGPHLPVGTDTAETYAIALRAGEAAGVPTTPPIWFGNSRMFLDFPGTLSVRPEVLKEFIKDVALSLIRHGFDKVIVLDGHGGNYGILDLLVEELHLETQALACHVRAWELATLPKPAGTPDYDGHGGSSETSAMLALSPVDVDPAQFVDAAPEVELTRLGAVFPSPSGLLSKGPVTIALSMGEMTALGHQGAPRFASAERGEALLRVKVEALVEFIEAIKGGRLAWRGRPKVEPGGGE